MKKKRRSAYLLESLEARLLFSADMALPPVDGGNSGAGNECDLEISLRRFVRRLLFKGGLIGLDGKRIIPCFHECITAIEVRLSRFNFSKGLSSLFVFAKPV